VSEREKRADDRWPYLKIVRAGNAGRGTRLTAEECERMSLDGAIEAIADYLEAGVSDEDYD